RNRDVVACGAACGPPGEVARPDPLVFARRLAKIARGGAAFARERCASPADLLRSALEAAAQEAERIAALGAPEAAAALLSKNPPVTVRKSTGTIGNWGDKETQARARLLAEEWCAEF